MLGQGSPIKTRSFLFLGIGAVLLGTLLITGFFGNASWGADEKFNDIPDFTSSANLSEPVTVPSPSVDTLAASQNPSQEFPIRLNITWNSAEPVFWSGAIQVQNGCFWNSQPLGSDLSASSTFQFQAENKGLLPFKTSNPVPFCGVQTTVAAPLAASLAITLKGEGNGISVSRSFTLAELLKEPVQIPFDVHDHGLVIQRVPGDEIPVSVSRWKDGSKVKYSSMVFSEGETLGVGIFTRYLPQGQGGSRQLCLSLRPSSQEEAVWNQSIDLTDDLLRKNPRLDIPVTIPALGGGFDLQIDLVELGESGKNIFSISKNTFTSSKDMKKGNLLASRKIQGVVVPSLNVSADSSEESSFDLRETLLETIDPANPAWWKIFARRSIFSENVLKTSLKNPLSIGGNASSPKKIKEEGDKKGEAARKKQKGKTEDSSENEKNQKRFLGQADLDAEKESWTTDFLKMWQWGELQSHLKPLNLTGNWGQWDSLWQHSLGSGDLSTLNSQDPRDAAFVSLAPNEDPNQIPWESYSIPIKEPGTPHLLEIEYLSDVPQSLGVSILEPSVSGGIFPHSLDNGLVVKDSPFSDSLSHRILRYQILFWPKTKTPMILVMNRDTHRPAIYGRIRVYQAKKEIPSLMNGNAEEGKRSFQAMMSRPFFCEQFHAENKPSQIGVLGAPDWETFYQGTNRMIDYLKLTGYDSLILSMAADGSALYPSEILKPNPKFDAGIFLKEGNDPIRKDVSEFLFRSFRQEEMKLIPLLSFNAPLPLLENSLKNNSNRKEENLSPQGIQEGIYLVGPQGEFLTKNKGKNEKIKVYNILHPAVQTEVLRVIQEFIDRYQTHSSLGGLALDLSPDTFIRLPENIFYGLDDETIARFVRETQLEKRIPPENREALNDFLSASDFQRYYRRALFIRDYVREDWIRWRAMAVSQFYFKASQILTARRPDLSLYLTGITTSSGNEVSPFLTEKAGESLIGGKIIRSGIDLNFLLKAPHIVLFRSSEINPLDHRGEISEDFGNDSSLRFFAQKGGEQGTLFYYDALPVNIPSFDQNSPFHPTVTQIAARCVRSDFQNRKYLAHQLAVCDTPRIAMGGEMIPMGEEEAIRAWISAYRSLPAENFVTWKEESQKGEESKTTDPVVIRYLKTENDYWVYLINDAPFHCGVDLTMEYASNKPLEILGGGREMTGLHQKANGVRWSGSLKPYDLIAFRTSDPKTILKEVKISLPKDICGDHGRIREDINGLVDRLKIAAEGLEVSLTNPSFEGFLPENGSGNLLTDSKENSSFEDEPKSPLALDVSKINLLHNPFSSGKMDTNKMTREAEKTSVSSSGIIGWQFQKNPRFRAELDLNHSYDGEKSLKLTQCGEVGEILSQSFSLEGSGRLLVNLAWGIPNDVSRFPMKISLVGLYHGEPWSQDLNIDPILRRRETGNVPKENLKIQDGMVWVRDFVLFDHLPTEGLEKVSLRFTLLSEGNIWVDDIHLYEWGFDREERKEIAGRIQKIQTEIESGCVRELLTELSSPLALYLAEKFPQDSPLMVRRMEMNEKENTDAAPSKIAGRDVMHEPTPTLEEKESEKKSFIKKILPW